MIGWLQNLISAPEPATSIERVEPVIDEGGGVRNDADSWNILRGIFESAPKVAGANVDHKTAMRVSAVYACVRLISGAVAGLPLHFYRRTSDGNRERVEHPYASLLNRQPVPGFPASAMWEFTVAQMLLRGDGPAYLERDNRSGIIRSIIPLKRDQVVIKKEHDGNPRHAHRLRYYISTPDGAFGAQQEDVLHFPGFGFDGLHGMSVIEWGGRTSTGIAIGADRYAGKYFENGGAPQFALKAKGRMTEEQQEALRGAWIAKYSGTGPNSIPLILTEGLEMDQLTMTAKDAQLLESRQWQAIDIARAFGVPPYMIGETSGSTSWGSGIEQQGIGFVVFTLAPHLRRIENELNNKLFPGDETMFVEFNTSALMQGDHAARADYYQKALGGTQNPAWMVPNEVRKLENLPPIDGGDTLANGGSSNGP